MSDAKQTDSTDLLGLSALLPACWALTQTLDERETTTRGYLWFTNPKNTSWEPLYRRAALDRVLAHSREAVTTSEHMHARNDELRLLVSDMGSLMLRMVAGIDHLAEIARQWEPDHSSGADRAGWVRATDAKAEAMKLMAELPGRIHRPNVAGNRLARQGQSELTGLLGPGSEAR